MTVQNKRPELSEGRCSHYLMKRLICKYNRILKYMRYQHMLLVRIGVHHYEETHDDVIFIF